jgi:hypothetical protein
MSKIIAVSRLMKLCETGRKVTNENATRSGAYRDQVGDAVENYALHRQAYQVASRAYKLLHKDELKGQEYIDNAIMYLEMIRDNFEGHEGDFDKAAKAKEAEEAAAAKQAEQAAKSEEKQVASNVRALRGIRKLDPRPVEAVEADTA